MNFMNRRQFILTTAAAGVAGLTAPVWLNAAEVVVEKSQSFDEQIRELLRDWCDGLIRLQVVAPEQPESHGAFRCPACGFFHGRCGDALLPLLAMADQTGESRYLDAALRAAAWTKNVSQSDGSWSNELDPTSWKGTTIFTAIAFAEALEWHGRLLDADIRTAWRERLKKAGNFIFEKLRFDAASGDVSVGGKEANVNYGIGGVYALALLGRLLDEKRFQQRSGEFAGQAMKFLSAKNNLVFGEGHPTNTKTTKGCFAVDLGYNVEESLPNLVHYALLTGDKVVLETAVASYQSHLEFMLPDGAWDNSWGTRSFKWTYWGSRTTDGSQAALVRLASRNPVFATAALRNLELLRACTLEGLLHGGPHYASHGVKPCVHHTFCHAKSLAGALHYRAELKNIQMFPPLPRSVAQGVKHFPEMDVTIAAIGPWRATFSGYDWAYKPGLFQAKGGAPGILWHEKIGPVLSASLARYLRVEETNMQLPPDGEDFPLTVRVERRTSDGGWFTNLHDGKAKVRQEAGADGQRIVVKTRLLSVEEKDPEEGPCRFELVYQLTPEKFSITARSLDPTNATWSLVVPVIAKSDESARQVAPSCWEVAKPAGRLLMISPSAIERLPSRRERIFNLVPGLEALPLHISTSGSKSVECTLQFIS
jgi:hypothetical protein